MLQIKLFNDQDDVNEFLSTLYEPQIKDIKFSTDQTGNYYMVIYRCPSSKT